MSFFRHGRERAAAATLTYSMIPYDSTSTNVRKNEVNAPRGKEEKRDFSPFCIKSLLMDPSSSLSYVRIGNR
jgi:hypothetical protein